MIQRIQTIYLLIVAVVMIAMVFFPLGYLYPEGGGVSMFDAFGMHGQDHALTWFLFVLPVSSLLLSVLTIFFYKRRKLQIKLGYLTLFIIVLIYIVGIFFLWELKQQHPATISFTIICIFPLIAFILEALAIRGIKKDEKLIRSLNRLRP